VLESLTLRSARNSDEAAVLALLRENKGLELAFHADEFRVAVEGHDIVGCGRLKRHSDGSLEIASVSTKANLRGKGIGSCIVEAILAGQREPIYALALAPDFFARHGFRLIDKQALPATVREKADTLCASQPYKAMVFRPR
jgi:N-acetylglutamate synthase-like GNAT family acetyltransferase